MKMASYHLSFTAASLRPELARIVAETFLTVGDWALVKERILSTNALQCRTASSAVRLESEMRQRLETLTCNQMVLLTQAYGLPAPKGVLIVGIPGTGKSLAAKATAKVFNVPLLKLDAGKLYGSLVGQSENNVRSVIQTAEAIAPCCLWIVEMEKGFSGSKSSSTSDGGT